MQIDEKFVREHEWVVSTLLRHERKLSNFTVSGAAFSNDPESMSLCISFPRPVDPPPPQEPDWLRVIVKWVGGSDGSASAYASWTYDLYWPSDTEYEHKLAESPIEPECSRARYMEGKVTKAPDGSTASAYRANDGTIKLWELQEKRAKGSCS